MKKQRQRPVKPEAVRWYQSPNVPLGVIRRCAREVAQRFQPDKIILFSSSAYGQPDADSDVDILVVMPARNQIDQAVWIDRAVDAPFPLDLIVRTPRNMAWRLKEGDDFLREIVAKGKILYEKADGRVGAQSRIRLSGCQKTRPGLRALPRPTLLPPSTASSLRGLKFLTRFALGTRYPGERATKRQAAAALR